MIPRPLLGIFRETLHSPDRVFDDFEILRLTAEALRAEGVDVELIRPEQISTDWWSDSQPEIAFLMCEQERMLEPLVRLGASRNDADQFSRGDPEYLPPSDDSPLIFRFGALSEQ